MTKNIQKHLIIFSILLISFAVIYFKYLLAPLDAKHAEDLKKLSQVESKLEDTKRKAVELPMLQADMRSLELEVADLEKLLPKDVEIPALLRTITKTAQKYQLKISNLNPNPPISQQNYNEITFQMTIQGSYHAFAYFISDIGQEPRILSIRNINFTSSQVTKENPNSINVNCVLVAYTFKG